MKIIYIANVRFPTERAHGVQIMNTCAALFASGHEVELVVPKRKNTPDENPFDFYHMPHRFPVTYIPSVDTISVEGGNRIAFIVQSITFLWSVLRLYRRVFNNKHTIVYGREEMILAPLCFFARNVFWESHMGNNNFFTKILVKKAKGIVCITNALARFYADKSVKENRLHVAPDAVDVSLFEKISSDAAGIRSKLKLPLDKKIVTYSGSLGLYSWKGVDVFLDALREIPDKDIVFMLVGGSQEEILTLQKKYTDARIVFVGQVKPHLVPTYLKASDALVIPNKPGNVISESFTSPMKLFEYMAAKKPIIASDLPSIREVVDEKTAMLYTPGDVTGLATAIRNVLYDSLRSHTLSEKAYAEVQKYTWVKRAAGIVDFLEHNHD